MRHIQVEAGLRLRFPERSAEFDEGVEIGIAAALMSLCARAFAHRISNDSLDQLRALAPKLGYHVVVEASGEGWSDVTLKPGPERPRLVLAHSRQAPEAEFAALPRAEFGALRRAELRFV